MIYEIAFPTETKINGKELSDFYRDSFKFSVNKTDLEARHVYHGIFGFLPKPIQYALALRNAVVKYFGFSNGNTEMALPLEDIQAGKQAGFLLIESVEPSEVICGAYESTMDMWISVLKLSDHEFSVSTLVNMKTKKGKVYMALIKPFHKLVVKYSIKQALKSGRI